MAIATNPFNLVLTPPTPSPGDYYYSIEKWREIGGGTWDAPNSHQLDFTQLPPDITTALQPFPTGELVQVVQSAIINRIDGGFDYVASGPGNDGLRVEFINIGPAFVSFEVNYIGPIYLGGKGVSLGLNKGARFNILSQPGNTALTENLLNPDFDYFAIPVDEFGKYVVTSDQVIDRFTISSSNLAGIEVRNIRISPVTVKQTGKIYLLFRDSKDDSILKIVNEDPPFDVVQDATGLEKIIGDVADLTPLNNALQEHITDKTPHESLFTIEHWENTTTKALYRGWRNNRDNTLTPPLINIVDHNDKRENTTGLVLSPPPTETVLVRTGEYDGKDAVLPIFTNTDTGGILFDTGLDLINASFIQYVYSDSPNPEDWPSALVDVTHWPDTGNIIHRIATYKDNGLVCNANVATGEIRIQKIKTRGTSLKRIITWVEKEVSVGRSVTTYVDRTPIEATPQIYRIPITGVVGTEFTFGTPVEKEDRAAVTVSANKNIILPVGDWRLTAGIYGLNVDDFVIYSWQDPTGEIQTGIPGSVVRSGRQTNGAGNPAIASVRGPLTVSLAYGYVGGAEDPSIGAWSLGSYVLVEELGQRSTTYIDRTPIDSAENYQEIVLTWPEQVGTNPGFNFNVESGDVSNFTITQGSITFPANSGRWKFWAQSLVTTTTLSNVTTIVVQVNGTLVGQLRNMAHSSPSIDFIVDARETAQTVRIVNGSPGSTVISNGRVRISQIAETGVSKQISQDHDALTGHVNDEDIHVNAAQVTTIANARDHLNNTNHINTDQVNAIAAYIIHAADTSIHRTNRFTMVPADDEILGDTAVFLEKAAYTISDTIVNQEGITIQGLNTSGAACIISKPPGVVFRLLDRTSPPTYRVEIDALIAFVLKGTVLWEIAK